MWINSIQCLVLVITALGGSSKVLELGSEFGDVNNLEEPHLVMFYAPWCGHCKSLHPIWYELGNKLSRQTITVARIDATIYRTAAEKFNVRGFPSLRLIAKDRAIEFVGDRTVEALSDFAIRGSRPLIESVGSLGKLNDLRRSDDVIFLSLNISEEVHQCLLILASSIVHETIVAEVKNSDILKVDGAIKATEVNDRTCLRPDLSISRSPGLLVLKDSKVYEYTGNIDDCLDVADWIRSERFSSFQKGSYPVIHPLIYLKYKIVFYLGESRSRIAEMEFISAERESLPDNFYFIHIDKAEYIESLISAFVEEESIVVFDPVTELYSYTTDQIESVKSILEGVVKGNVDLYGGTGVVANVKKVWYRLASNVLPLFTDHPIIMSLILLIPTGLIIFCCFDSFGSKEAEPERQVRSSESHMDLLWQKNENGKNEIQGEKDVEVEENLAEEKDPELKKDE